MSIFIKLADNEPYGCSLIVGTESRKWGHFPALSVHTHRLHKMVGLIKLSCFKIHQKLLSRISAVRRQSSRP